MKREQSLAYLSFKDFFNSLLLEHYNDLTKIPNTYFRHEDINIHKFEIKTKYGRNLDLLIIKAEKKLSKKEIKDFKDNLENFPINIPYPEMSLYPLESSNTNPFVVEEISDIENIINYIKDYNEGLALDIQKKYEDFCLNNSKEVNIYEKSFKEKQITMMNYLHSNDIKKEILNIDLTKNYTEKEYDDLYRQANKHEKKSSKIRGFNDLDYYPFIFENNYIIEDISSDSLWICKLKDENNFTWYSIYNRNNFEVEDNVHDLLYSTNQYIKKNIEEKCTVFNKCLEYKNGIMISLTKGFDIVNLLQNFIVNELSKENLITVKIPELSFKELLKNYTLENEVYQIEERAFISLLKNLVYINGRLSYEDINYIGKSELEVNHEDSQYVNSTYWEDLSDINIELKISDKKEILAYVKELEYRYPSSGVLDIVEPFIESLPTISNQSVNKKRV